MLVFQLLIGRLTTFLKTVLHPADSVFQFLIGRLITILIDEGKAYTDVFQLLIGRLTTRQSIQKGNDETVVSTPYR